MPSWRCRAVPGWSNGSGHVSHPEIIRGSLLGISTRDTWGAPKGLRRRSFGRACSEGVSKEAFGGASGHVACSEGAFRGGHVSKGFPKGSFGVAFVVGLGIDGWDPSVRSGRGELRSDR